MIIHNEKKIINNLSVKYKLNPKVIEDVISHSLKCIKDCICMDEMPDIMIHNLGRFKASLIIMEMRFKNFIINNENNALKDFDIDVMNRLIKVYDRKVKEDKKKHHINYYKVLNILNNISNNHKESNEEE